ncbi:hypothetical protein [Salinarimonas soli]|uniref:Uncharacterized protein n=1 Tax=Salinarimonas soli TaxID=1638099 RepID=A0A5B2VCI7_9HYPH|nr:hypothetical protein [Salinarimonas soli]KAA2236468.1 hypothetical protein F0L46_15115 [Salinarimonas soli]
MPDETNDRPVILTAPAPVQVEDFTLPPGTYAGMVRFGSVRKVFLIVTSADLALYGEPVRPESVEGEQEIDVTGQVGLGLLDVE